VDDPEDSLESDRAEHPAVATEVQSVAHEENMTRRDGQFFEETTRTAGGTTQKRRARGASPYRVGADEHAIAPEREHSLDQPSARMLGIGEDDDRTPRGNRGARRPRADPQ
jgi:hypothetical protein